MISALFAFFFGGFCFGEFLVETVNTAIGDNIPLLARIERMAVRAGFDFEFFPEGRTSFKRGSAVDAGHSASMIRWMDSFFHFPSLLSPSYTRQLREIQVIS